MITLHEAQCTHHTKKRFVEICPTTSIFTGENPIALLAVLANIKYTFDNCGVCDSEAARVQDTYQEMLLTKFTRRALILASALTLMFVVELAHWSSTPSFSVS